jgi:hypothetical protein
MAVDEAELTGGHPVPYLGLPDPVRRAGQQVGVHALLGGPALLVVVAEQHRATVGDQNQSQIVTARILIVQTPVVRPPDPVAACGVRHRGECGPPCAQLDRVVQIDERHPTHPLGIQGSA